MPNLTAQIKATGNCFVVRPPKLVSRGRVRVKQVSSKRAIQLGEYRKKRLKFLGENRICEVGALLLGSHCSCTIRATEIHHRSGRIGKKLNDEKDFLPTCRTCHDWCHRNPKEARALGLLK